MALETVNRNEFLRATSAFRQWVRGEIDWAGALTTYNWRGTDWTAGLRDRQTRSTALSSASTLEPLKRLRQLRLGERLCRFPHQQHERFLTPEQRSIASRLAVLLAELVNAGDGWASAGGCVWSLAVVEPEERLQGAVALG